MRVGRNRYEVVTTTSVLHSKTTNEMHVMHLQIYSVSALHARDALLFSLVRLETCTHLRHTALLQLSVALTRQALLICSGSRASTSKAAVW